MINAENTKIKSLIKEKLFLKEINVISNGKHFKIIAVGNIFNKLSQVKRQQMIYSCLMQYITNNLIHAVTIKAYTPEEWIKICKNN